MRRTLVCVVFLLLANLALAQSVSLTPAALSFSAQLVGTASAVKTVVLKNTSMTTALAITSITASGGFATTNCTSPIAASGTCTLSIACASF
jgi:hypothetical protein